MTNIVDNIKTKYHSWQENRFLKKHGCESWKQYHRKYDSDFNIRASEIPWIYFGYPYVYCFEDRQHEVYYWDIAIDGAFIITEWCEENLKNKFRFDFHRVVKDTHGNWVINELGGGDYIFAAFKDERDYTYFLLKWS
jgi:hypothetical protein